jgi:glycosidase
MMDRRSLAETKPRRIRPQATVAALCLGLFVAAGVSTVSASSLRVSAAATSRLGNEVEADYTTSHIFINEVKHDSVPITIFFDPQTLGVQTAEVFTNLNRRDRAGRDADGDGVEDGIKAPAGNAIAAGDDGNYYKAFPMPAVAGGYQLTLQANRCGVYRVTVRYRLNSDPPGTYRWYGDEMNAQGIHKRDHAVVVSPKKAADVQMYEVNPLTIVATGTNPSQRGNFADMANGLPKGSGPLFNLSYVKKLGCNMLWLLPIHAAGIDGRSLDPTTSKPYAVGSPYAVKNFFTVMPLMAKSFTPGGSPATNDTPAGRAQALVDFQQFVNEADKQGVGVMLDAPFNHAAHDVELGPPGQAAFGHAGTTPTTEIRAAEARFFSRSDEYDMRAFDATSVAQAPDRYDFGKWTDVYDIYFGRYAALVANAGQQGQYRDEGDWFDYSVGLESGAGPGNGHFDAITQRVWHYFAEYVDFWLTETGYAANPSGEALDSAAGIDGLRADFGQGLPPPCWEYIINRARTRKWDMVFMAESLDGGPVTYRSARQFDVLNENLIYDLHHARTTQDFRGIYEIRRNSYGAALVLLNTASHDEDNYKDPFEALLRFAANNALDGVPLISAGQELGLTGMIIPPHDSVSSAGPPFGYDRYENNFGKLIPQFKTFNSLMPLWTQAASANDTASRLANLYSMIGEARRDGPALRSSLRVYLNLKDGTPHGQIFSVGKFERRNADPKGADVVLAFVNLTVGSDAETAAGNSFNVNADADKDGVNDFGIKPGRLYNVKNVAAYTGSDGTRRDKLLWSSPRDGADLLANGVFVHLNRVPNNAAGWASAPYEAQYLKLLDVTP